MTDPGPVDLTTDQLSVVVTKAPGMEETAVTTDVPADLMTIDGIDDHPNVTGAANRGTENGIVDVTEVPPGTDEMIGEVGAVHPGPVEMIVDVIEVAPGIENQMSNLTTHPTVEGVIVIPAVRPVTDPGTLLLLIAGTGVDLVTVNIRDRVGNLTR